MASWNTGVTDPPVHAYTGAGSIFSALSNWGPDDPAQLRKEQEAKSFQQGLPIDPATGQVDAKALGAQPLKFGDFPLLEQLMPFIERQDQNRPSPFYGGGQAPAPPAGAAPSAYAAPPGPAGGAPSPYGAPPPSMALIASIYPQFRN